MRLWMQSSQLRPKSRIRGVTLEGALEHRYGAGPILRGQEECVPAGDIIVVRGFGRVALPLAPAHRCALAHQIYSAADVRRLYEQAATPSGGAGGLGLREPGSPLTPGELSLQPDLAGLER